MLQTTKEVQVINKMQKIKNQIIPPAITMKELLCFGSSKLSLFLSLDGVSDELEEISSWTKCI